MVLIALGSNLVSASGQSPAEILHAAIAALDGDSVHVQAVSSFYETAAWPNPADPVFVNAICKIGMELTPVELLNRLHAIERQFGRERSTRNAPRTLDLDIIDCNGIVSEGPPALPHPRLETRGFVLIPLRDVAPDWRHPVTGRTLGELIAALPAEARAVRRLDANP
ncbi:MAG TPA: 2-amino-4-hydroxy-6-hydroxymethyldihydropteridine diphosphokinase [Rhizomicrobium sp.]|jgi:2-amino-4-hydroxy-6-hydroxymethyldihydropteridine diphosphokinase|nr:2-amino-4-hydroxy-6-hydroxymethyldihydropteridine diphosphokinase [Rhizomicrobium sp.]